MSKVFCPMLIFILLQYFQVQMLVNRACKALCMDKNNKYVAKSLSKAQSNDFKEKILHDYYVHL